MVTAILTIIVLYVNPMLGVEKLFLKDILINKLQIFQNKWSQVFRVCVCVCVCCAWLFRCIPLLETLCISAHQATLSTGLFRQEYWSGLPFPSPGDLPNPGIKTVSFVSPALQTDSLLAELPHILYACVCVCMCVHIDIYLYAHIWN